MINKKLFFDGYRVKLDQNLSQKEVNAIDLFLDMMNSEFNTFTINQWAYVFATVYHETNQTFEPVIEAYWKTEEWRKRNLRYYPYYGRGYVQITWLANYQTLSEIIGADLVFNPELATNPREAFKILTVGMKRGLFTGKPLSLYVNELSSKFDKARRVINGTDKSELISDYALEFERILKIGYKPLKID